MKEEKVTVDYVQAQLVKMTEMYDNLLTKYRNEVEGRAIAEANFRAIYNQFSNLKSMASEPTEESNEQK